MTVSASFGLAGCAAIADLKGSISQWFDTVTFTGEGELSGNAREAAPMIAPENAPKEATKAPKKNIMAAARKLQRPLTVVLPPKRPPISDSPETEPSGNPRRPLRCDCGLPFPKRRRPEFFHAEIGHRKHARMPLMRFIFGYCRQCKAPNETASCRPSGRRGGG
jgi:hypothetical protein